MDSRFGKPSFERLEPDEGKLSSPVLRGLPRREAGRLPGVRPGKSRI